MVDKYEQILEEKIDNAKKELEALKVTPRQDGFTISRWIKITTLLEEEKTYLDALITYRNLKAKGEI